MIVEMRTYKVKRGTRPKILEVLRTKTFDELKRIGVKCWGPCASVEDETTKRSHRVFRHRVGTPASADAHCNLGNALLERGQTTAALEHLAEAVRLSPGTSAMHANYANALNQAGHAGEAAAQFGEALRLDPNDGLAHYNYGNLLLKAGRAYEAIDQYEAAQRLLPGNDAVRNNLNIARQRAGLATPLETP